jgi:hypothetical protein
MRIARATIALAIATSVAWGAPSQVHAQAAPNDEGDPNAEAAPPDEGDTPADAETYADTDPSALTDFRDALDPHGVWIDDPNYGLVWVPNADEVGADFTPYLTGGHWAYDVDYLWVSDYAWGWVAFHYGRWVRVENGVWVWIAGRRYAGAWVDWRIGDDQAQVVGWAPAPPRWVWLGGAPFRVVARSRPSFVYCPRAEVFSAALRARVVVGGAAAALASRTRAYVPANPTVVAHPSSLTTQAAALTPPAPVPVRRGPPPASLGLTGERVVAVNPQDPSVARARAFSRATTAAAFGAHAPAVRVSRPMVAAPPPAPRPHVPAPQPGNRRR